MCIMEKNMHTHFQYAIALRALYVRGVTKPLINWYPMKRRWRGREISLILPWFMEYRREKEDEAPLGFSFPLSATPMKCDLSWRNKCRPYSIRVNWHYVTTTPQGSENGIVFISSIRDQETAGRPMKYLSQNCSAADRPPQLTLHSKSLCWPLGSDE